MPNYLDLGIKVLLGMVGFFLAYMVNQNNAGQEKLNNKLEFVITRMAEKDVEVNLLKNDNVNMKEVIKDQGVVIKDQGDRLKELEFILARNGIK